MSGSVWPTPIGRLERDVSSTLARTSLVTANADLGLMPGGHFLPFPGCKNRTTFNTQKCGHCCAISKSNAARTIINERKYFRWEIYRADSLNRVGLRQQQFGPGLGSAGADRSSACGLDAGFERPRRRAKGAIESRYPGQEVDYAGVSRLSRGREKIQIPQASPARAIQHDSGAVSREMGIGAGLSDGGAELCRRSFAPGQTNGTRPATATAQ